MRAPNTEYTNDENIVKIDTVPDTLVKIDTASCKSYVDMGTVSVFTMESGTVSIFTSVSGTVSIFTMHFVNEI